MDKYDMMEIRCPRLGGEVTFAYCRKEQGDLPCSSAIRCWQPYFPVEGYLKEALNPEEWDRFYKTPPKGRIATIFETVAKIERQK